MPHQLIWEETKKGKGEERRETEYYNIQNLM